MSELIPLDYFLWYIRLLVYVMKLATILTQEDNITADIGYIPNEI